MQHNARINERGAAALLTIVGISIIFLLIFTGLILVELSGKLVARQLRYQGQALNAAEAGLTEGLSWFRRQQTQPVIAFTPQRDLSADPPVNDTEDPDIGIARTYRISRLGNVYGRYEVRLLGYDINGNGTVDSVESKRGVQDVSSLRGNPAGSTWRLESEGIVFVQNDEDAAYNVYPNQVILRTSMRTELRRLSIVLPGGNSAINAAQGSGVDIGNSCRVRGGSGGIGIAYAAGTGTPVVGGGGSVTGNPPQSQTTNPFTISSVFGVTEQELIGLADLVIPDFNAYEDPLPEMKLIVIQGNATFNSVKPLTGSGILVVLGNLTISANSNSNYNGLIYVQGNYQQLAPSLVSGAVVGTQQVHLVGSGDYSEVDFSGSILQQIQRQMGSYRFSRAPYLYTPGEE